MSVSPTALWQIFDDHSRGLSSRDAVVYGETRLTYEELLDRSRAVAASWLDRAKADRGMRILILLNDPLEILVSILAAWNLDSTAAVLRPYGAERVPRLYLDTILPDLIVTADGVRAPEGDRSSQFLRSPEECLILGTSGTTAEPKFAAISVSCIDLTTSTIADDRASMRAIASRSLRRSLTSTASPGERSWLFGRGRPSFSMPRHSFRVLSRRLFGVTRSPSCRERHRPIGWGSSFGTARRSRACE
jgi:acyl-CoA synthetase (AMP-forming)/AMP-acid ligase II